MVLVNTQSDITIKLQAHSKQNAGNVYDLRIIKDDFNEAIIFEWNECHGAKVYWLIFSDAEKGFLFNIYAAAFFNARLFFMRMLFKKKYA